MEVTPNHNTRNTMKTPPQIPPPATLAEVETWKASSTAIALLGANLQPSDSHDEEGALMTTDAAWYFVPCEGDPVMSRITIRNPQPMPTERLKWRIEIVKIISGYPYEPDDYDLVEDGDRQDTLIDAIIEASRLAHSFNVRNVCEGIYWDGEHHMEKLGAYKI
jgi:hypothetical protein